jgi:hypothetical protein
MCEVEMMQGAIMGQKEVESSSKGRNVGRRRRELESRRQKVSQRLSDYDAIAMRFQRSCEEIAMRLQRDCIEIAMRLH